MANTLVNIGDFRCRGNRSLSANGARDGEERRGLMLVPEVVEPERESLKQALLAENPPVYDIAIAREATRMHRRLVLRPIPIATRRAQIFSMAVPEAAVTRGKEFLHGDRRQAATNDFDLPPAA